MTRLSAVELFSNWADIGKDEGMELGHSNSVEVMISAAIKRINNPFKSIDVGCGNGWAVRRLANLPECSSSCGVDGSESMIRKARLIDPEGKYFVGSLPNWTPQEKFDLVISMEFLYYLDMPFFFLELIIENWLKPGGCLVVGIDHYLENEQSIEWPEKLGVHMTSLSTGAWIEGFEKAGLRNVEHLIAGENDEWGGTLIIIGEKEKS